MPTDTIFDRPRRALPRIAFVAALHALVLFVFVTADRIVLPQTPYTVMLLSNVAPQVVEPPPSPPLPPRRKNKPRPPARETAAPPPRDIEVVPRTEVAATIVAIPLPVELAGGKPDGTGTAGAGDQGEGAGGGGGGHIPVKVRAVVNPDNCERPRLPRFAEERRVAGDVILAVLINVDGWVTDARVARSSGEPILDRTALATARKCHFVAATIDKVPVPSWEPFRFSWVNR
ncbi:energy transducer TonB [Massilia sp. GER05]|uniref:energy transducer TonB n=1 Tax=Massilia sp. GER05 TaxID=3394605 RepID=UPI003F8280E0